MMNNTPLSPVSPDPLVSIQAKLEAVRERIMDDMKKKEVGFEFFKEETLWRLNTLSDRTIEIAREEESEVEERLKRELVEAEAVLADWKARFQERLYDEEWLDTLIDKAFKSLLEPFSAPLDREDKQ